MDQQKHERRRQIFKRLKLTGRNETICLMGWETEILVDWIIELKERTKSNEQNSHYRKPDGRS
jgi:hypothetical protein